MVVILVFVLHGWLWGTAAALAVLGGALLADYHNWRDKR